MSQNTVIKVHQCRLSTTHTQGNRTEKILLKTSSLFIASLLSLSLSLLIHFQKIQLLKKESDRNICVRLVLPPQNEFSFFTFCMFWSLFTHLFLHRLHCLSPIHQFKIWGHQALNQFVPNTVVQSLWTLSLTSVFVPNMLVQNLRSLSFTSMFVPNMLVQNLWTLNPTSMFVPNMLVQNLWTPSPTWLSLICQVDIWGHHAPDHCPSVIRQFWIWEHKPNIIIIRLHSRWPIFSDRKSR